MEALTQPWPVRRGARGFVVAAALAIGLLAALAFADAPISAFGRSLPPPAIDFFALVTRLGESDYILIPALVLWLMSAGLGLVIPRRPARLALMQMAGIWAFVFVGVGLPSLITTLLKRLVGRARPEVDGAGAFDFKSLPWLDWQYQSFPSGHATTAFAFCFAVSFLFPRAYLPMLGLAVLICLSRIVLGAHYPTDLVAGAVIGTLGAYLVRNVFARRRWVFEFAPDGQVVQRRPAAVARFVSGRRP
jgi:undecaprenyl-diphosphatase